MPGEELRWLARQRAESQAAPAAPWPHGTWPPAPWSTDAELSVPLDYKVHAPAAAAATADRPPTMDMDPVASYRRRARVDRPGDLSHFNLPAQQVPRVQAEARRYSPWSEVVAHGMRQQQLHLQRHMQRDAQHGFYAPMYPPPAHKLLLNKGMVLGDAAALDQGGAGVANHAAGPEHMPPPFPGWALQGLPPGAAGAARRNLQLRMVDMFPLGLNMVAQEGSAFQRVVRSSSDLGYMPHSRKAAALPPGEKAAETVPKLEFLPSPCSDSRVSGEDGFKDLVDHEKGHTFSCGEEEESTDDSKQSSDIGLPFKKRKPRLDNSKMEHVQAGINYSSKDNMRYCQFHENECRYCQYHNFRDLQGNISLAGKFNTWTSEQVQLWLWQTLKESNKFSANAICKTLQKINGANGFDLTTFTKNHWEEKLSDCDEPTADERMWEFVWGLVIEKSRDTSLRPHNYSTDLSSREMDMIVHSHYGGNMSASVENTTLNKKLNKPPRRRRDKCVGQLWEFVYNLLQNKDMENVVRWEDKEKQLFRIVNTEQIARLWGNHKGNRHMTYANMSRTMRYYREGNGAFVRNERKRVYGFGPKANLKRLEAKAGRKLVK